MRAAARYLRARLQLAHLPFVKTCDHFDFGFQPSIDERQIRELRTLRFIHEASNVVLLGPPGVGKTHLSAALAEAAIQAGFGAYFMTAHDLVTDLGRAYREGRLDRRMRVFRDVFSVANASEDFSSSTRRLHEYFDHTGSALGLV
jgi:DNA replication protein DnaC